jgi:hypothetical protein
VITLKNEVDREEEKTTELILGVILAVLIILTAIAGFEYLKRIKLAHKEYLKAKTFIEDIVLSFDRELHRETVKFDNMIKTVDASNTTAESSFRKAENLESNITTLQLNLESLAQTSRSMSQLIEQNFNESKQNNSNIVSEFAELLNKIKELSAIQDDLKTRMGKYEEQVQRIVITPPDHLETEAKEFALPPIPPGQSAFYLNRNRSSSARNALKRRVEDCA